jgi:hypothetical protein
MSKEQLLAIIGDYKYEKDDLVSSTYKLLTCDVRDAEIIKSKLDTYEVNRSLPTLLITECLMIYMSGADSLEVYTWVKDYFTGDLASVNYEMINPDDQFGKMMVNNL